MKIFLDTANVEEIKKAWDMGLIDGVTTNPSLVAKEGKSIYEVITEISKIVHGPISAEVISLDYDGMVVEAKKLSSISPNVVVKIPMCKDGIRATKRLSELGIKTNVTLIFSIQQGLLAAKAGATYISPFVGRLDDIGLDGMELVRDLLKALKSYNLETEVIAASIRHQKHIIDCINCSVDIATIPYNQVLSMMDHPLTKIGIDKFMADYNKDI